MPTLTRKSTSSDSVTSHLDASPSSPYKIYLPAIPLFLPKTVPPDRPLRRNHDLAPIHTEAVPRRELETIGDEQGQNDGEAGTVDESETWLGVEEGAEEAAEGDERRGWQ